MAWCTRVPYQTLGVFRVEDGVEEGRVDLKTRLRRGGLSWRQSWWRDSWAEDRAEEGRKSPSLDSSSAWWGAGNRKVGSRPPCHLADWIGSIGKEFYTKEHTKKIFNDEKLMSVENLYYYHCAMDMSNIIKFICPLWGIKTFRQAWQRDTS